MIISFDSRAYLLSKINNLKRKVLIKNRIYDFKFSFLGEGSGPQNFISDLINAINENKLARTTFNFLISDCHLLNYGFFSQIWRKYDLKPKNKLLLRLDGIEIDSDNQNLEQKKYEFLNLANKTEVIIYQSNFSKCCFKSVYSTLPAGKVISNGASKLSLPSPYTNNILTDINKLFQTDYFTVAGRFTSRKRIAEVINEFNENEIGNLVVLSNVPNKFKFNNKRILYLGILNPNTARHIIANSLALIHFDKYDWCPNLVISAIKDGTPVICSNFGGTPEIAKNNGLIINEYPKDLPNNIEGINYVKKSNFPSKIFKDNINSFNRKDFSFAPDEYYDIKRAATEYIKVANYLTNKRI